MMKKSYNGMEIFDKIFNNIFKSKSYLATHIKSLHKRFKYPCDQCGKQFTGQEHQGLISMVI